MKNAFAITRRTAAIALLAVPLLAAHAADFPSKPIRFIVPYTPGGTTDLVARTVGQKVSEKLGQPVLIDNRGGAGGNIGMDAVAKAAPDGYTIGMGTASTLAINPATYKNLPFDVLSDLSPIGNIAAVPNIMAIHPGVAAADIRAFIALAKSSPASSLMPRPATARSRTCLASSSSSRPAPISSMCRTAAWDLR